MSDQQGKVVLDAPAPQPTTPSPVRPAAASGLSRGTLFAISILLTLVGLALVFVVVPGKTTEIQKRGVQAEGQVLMKDSQTVGGQTQYTVRFVYEDARKVNHDAVNQLVDAGQWQSLKPNQFITVYYLPDKPEEAFMPGAAGMVAPHSRSLSFLGWTALVAAIPLWVMAFMAPKGARKPKRSRGPVVTRR